MAAQLPVSHHPPSSVAATANGDRGAAPIREEPVAAPPSSVAAIGGGASLLEGQPPTNAQPGAQMDTQQIMLKLVAGLLSPRAIGGAGPLPSCTDGGASRPAVSGSTGDCDAQDRGRTRLREGHGTEARQGRRRHSPPSKRRHSYASDSSGVSDTSDDSSVETESSDDEVEEDVERLMKKAYKKGLAQGKGKKKGKGKGKKGKGKGKAKRRRS